MEQPSVAIIAPCYNEGDVALRFLDQLAAMLAGRPERFTVWVVDDGSTDDTPAKLRSYRSDAPNVAVRVHPLPYNRGHQEAILEGLRQAAATDAARFIVMDADGEDAPADLPDLLDQQGTSIVLVARGARSASPGFRLGLALYRLLFRLVAGRPMVFGNFSLIDRRVLQAALDRPFVHYAAFLTRQRVPTTVLVRDRDPRLGGRSKMDIGQLSLHAFRSLLEYGDEVLYFLLRAFLWLALFFLLSVAGIVGIKLFTDLAIPGWASILSATLFNAVLLCLGSFAIGLLLVAQERRRAMQRPGP